MPVGESKGGFAMMISGIVFSKEMPNNMVNVLAEVFPILENELSKKWG